MAEQYDELDKIKIPDEIPLLPLRGAVVFPPSVIPISVGRPNSVKLIDDASIGNKIFGVVAQKDMLTDDPDEKDLYRIGTAVRLIKMLKLPDNSVQLLIQGISRITIKNILQKDPYFKAKVEAVDIDEEITQDIEALTRNITETIQKITPLSPRLGNDLYTILLNVKNPSIYADIVVSSLNLPLEEQQQFLETYDVKKRLEMLNVYLNKELQLTEISSKIQEDIKTKFDKTQKEFILREQLKAIRKELGEDADGGEEIKELREKIEKAGMPPDVEKEAKKELDRMSKITPASPEYTVSNTYLDWLTSLPWSVTTEDRLDIGAARKVLNEDHYDLEKIKDRILEFLSIRKLKKDTKGPILCFVGPPGVGKTSLGKSIARALGRKFIRISLGGIRDEADIRGHRRTYIGSMPGRIIQGIRRAGSNNPVFMMDEVDKIGLDFRGDPASALLEVLDPEQNNSFSDHYLDVPFDLSKVMFITTANVMDTIPAPLRDRMEVLSLPGYIEEEKLMIAKSYLVPRQLEANGLDAGKLKFEDKALLKIIRDYTREAGLRNLEREIGTVCRKSAVKFAEGSNETVVISEKNIEDYLGAVKFFSEVAERIKQPGVAIGLAWTQAGGDILFVEATKMKGKKSLVLTGQLGDVMKESAQAALSFIRSKAKSLKIQEDFFDKYDIHIHVPAGAIPKDGPSAGVTMAVALASLLTGKKVVPFLAMTGEITLRGNVLPVGGIKEKVLAANRAGIKTILLPERNKKDLEDVPQKVKEELKFILIDNIEQAIKEALRSK